MELETLLGQSPAELKALVARLGLPKYASQQLGDWLYKKHAESFDEMTNLAKATRARLNEIAQIGASPPREVQVSSDGTKKYLFRSLAGDWIESAWIPEPSRSTLCLSTQAGCRMGCLFCATAGQGLSGQVSRADILNQFRSLPERDRVSNIVYMGMGEPLDNLDEVLASIKTFCEPWGMGLSPRRITVSTCGLIKPLKTLLDETEVHLALSLHNPFDHERARLMPIAKSQPLEELFDLLRTYNWRGQRRLTLEYILFSGYNDGEDHLKQLVRLSRGLGEPRINLLRWNPVPEKPDLRGASEERLSAWVENLNQTGLIATVRRSRGSDIQAACGLLSTARIKADQPLP